LWYSNASAIDDSIVHTIVGNRQQREHKNVATRQIASSPQAFWLLGHSSLGLLGAPTLGLGRGHVDGSSEGLS
jgi:hypothetical protein